MYCNAGTIDETLSSLDAFYASEDTIRHGVAGTSELSMFTHGNLAETYFYSILAEFGLGLFHFRRAAELATDVFGNDHPHAKAKLRDLQSALERLGCVYHTSS